MDKRADIWLQDNKLLFPEAGDEPKKCGSPVASLRSKIKSLRIDNTGSASLVPRTSPRRLLRYSRLRRVNYPVDRFVWVPEKSVRFHNFGLSG